MIELVVGGPPCQGFSQKGSRLGLKDDRNFYFKKFIEVVETVKPSVFVMENVPNLITTNNGYFFSIISKHFKSLGYKIDSKVSRNYHRTSINQGSNF